MLNHTKDSTALSYNLEEMKGASLPLKKYRNNIQPSRRTLSYLMDKNNRSNTYSISRMKNFGIDVDHLSL